VDLVLGSNGCLVIEVNPRLTVAYAGVRRVVDCNLAQAITAACLDGVLPERIEVSGQVRFGEKG
jgi:predicted ATP-grasp superfamily ATP-dependent carboligase